MIDWIIENQLGRRNLAPAATDGHRRRGDCRCAASIERTTPKAFRGRTREKQSYGISRRFGADANGRETT